VVKSNPYIDDDAAGLEIYFNTPQLSLADIGLVSSSLDYLLNKTAALMVGVSTIEPFLFEDWFLGRRWYPSAYASLVTAQLTDLHLDSFSVRTRVRLNRIFRDSTINITSGLIVAALLTAVASHGGKASGELRQPEIVPDLGPNITALSQSLSATGKPWELRIKDSQNGVEVTITGNSQMVDR
jgi:hypothetical protein